MIEDNLKKQGKVKEKEKNRGRRQKERGNEMFTKEARKKIANIFFSLEFILKLIR